MNSLTKQITPEQACDLLVSKLATALNEAAALVAEWHRNDPTFIAQMKATGKLSSATLNRLVDLASGQVNPRLGLDGDRASAAIAKLPRLIQDEVISQGVEVVDPDGESRQIPFDQLTTKQVKQVFNDKKIRQPAEQITWLKAQQPTPARLPRRWTVTRGKHVIIHGTNQELSKDDLLQLLAQI